MFYDICCPSNFVLQMQSKLIVVAHFSRRFCPFIDILTQDLLENPLFDDTKSFSDSKMIRKAFVGKC